jgi:integrase
MERSLKACRTGEIQYRDRRLLTLYFDMSAMPVPDQIRALDYSEKFIRTQMQKVDLVAIMRYQGSSVDVLVDFTDEQARYASSTINLRLAAIRRLAYEAADCGLLSPDLAAGIRRVKGVKKHGARLENWLTADQGKRLLATFDGTDLRGKRDYAMIALLLGCGLRRAEVAGLAVEHLQQREEHWVIADLVGKGNHVRTVPVPSWVKEAVDSWTTAAGVSTGPVFRAINKAKRIATKRFSPKVIWSVVRAGSSKCGLDRIAPHDLRRTCARLCHEAGGELEQIQFLLCHVSVQTTERYLGCKQRLRNAVNDKIGLEPLS